MAQSTDAHFHNTESSLNRDRILFWRKADNFFTYQHLGRKPRSLEDVSDGVNQPQYPDIVLDLSKLQQIHPKSSDTIWVDSLINFEHSYGMEWALLRFLIDKSNIMTVAAQGRRGVQIYNPFLLSDQTLCIQFLNMRTAVLYHYLVEPFSKVRVTSYKNTSYKFDHSIFSAHSKDDPFRDLTFKISVQNYCQQTWKMSPSRFIADVLERITNRVKRIHLGNWDHSEDIYRYYQRKPKWLIFMDRDLTLRTIAALVIMRWGLIEEPQLQQAYENTSVTPTFTLPYPDTDENHIPSWKTFSSGFLKATIIESDNQERLICMGLRNPAQDQVLAGHTPTTQEEFVNDWMDVMGIDLEKVDFEMPPVVSDASRAVEA